MLLVQINLDQICPPSAANIFHRWQTPHALTYVCVLSIAIIVYCFQVSTILFSRFLCAFVNSTKLFLDIVHPALALLMLDCNHCFLIQLTSISNRFPSNSSLFSGLFHPVAFVLFCCLISSFCHMLLMLDFHQSYLFYFMHIRFYFHLLDDDPQFDAKCKNWNNMVIGSKEKYLLKTNLIVNDNSN